MNEELFEFPVLVGEDKVVTLFLNKNDREKATTDEDYLWELIEKEKEKDKENEIPGTSAENPVDPNNSDKTKSVFVWPDKAVLLLLELYREREEAFSTGTKRNNKIWAEIATSMYEVNSAYEVTGQQCSTKMSGLKRTYKNIVDQNKKSGNHRSSWAFFSVLDSLFGEKVSNRPLATATSDGPVSPLNEETSTSTSTSTSSPTHSKVGSPQRKKRKTECMLEQVLANMLKEKEERGEEIKRLEAQREQRRLDRERRHEEQIKVQTSLISTLKQFLDKM